MKRRRVIQILLITVIIAASSSMLFETDAADVYTTTMTERYTTTLTSRITETLTMTSTSYTTRTETAQTVIETPRVIMTSQTVIVPTIVVIPPRTTAVTNCMTLGNVIECITRIIPYRLNTVTTLVPAIIVKSTTVTSWITSYNTMTETETINREEQSVTTRTETLTLTLENIYTSLYTSAEASLPQNTTGLDVSAIISNNLTLLLIAIILILVAALAIRLIRTRTPRHVSGIYCINCGKPIERGVKHCPQCGALQK